MRVIKKDSKKLVNYTTNNKRFIELNSESDVGEYCVNIGLLEKPKLISSISNGYANNVWKIDSDKGVFFVKQILPHLKRNPDVKKQKGAFDREVLGNKTIAKILPGAVPYLVWADKHSQICITKSFANDKAVSMDTANPLGEEYSTAVERVVELIFQIQSKIKACQSDMLELLQNNEFLCHQYSCLLLQLPFPTESFADRTNEVVNYLYQTPQTIVLFDVSPKNVLVYENQVAFCDTETTCIGSAVFDVGYFLGNVLFDNLTKKSLQNGLDIVSTIIERAVSPRFSRKSIPSTYLLDIIAATLLYRKQGEVRYNKTVVECGDQNVVLSEAVHLAQQISERKIKLL